MDKITRLWANSGTKTAPTTTKQDAGWVNNEQVPHEWANWLQDKVEAKINEVIEERINSYYDGASDHQLMLTTGLWADPWGNGADDANAISAGATKELKSLAVTFDADGKPYVMAFDDSLSKVEVYDARAMTLSDTSPDLTTNLPSGSSEVWECQSMISDGTYVYITFMDSNASPETFVIQAWDIALWGVKSGWPATGTVLPGTGTFSSGSQRRAVFADATNIAVANVATTISAAASAAISIVSIATGTISASGAGDAPTGVSAQTLDLASDGTNIIFGTFGGGNSYLCSATIADPTLGSGGSNYPLTTSGSVNMVSCGENMIVSSFGPSPSETAIVLRSSNATDADLEAVIYGRTGATTPKYGYETVFEYPAAMVFDGVNAWVLAQIDNIAASGQWSLCKFDVARLSITDTDNHLRLMDVVGHVSIVGGDETTAGGTGTYYDMVFDGRDIWMILEDRASQGRSGKIFRLPLALLRG